MRAIMRAGAFELLEMVIEHAGFQADDFAELRSRLKFARQIVAVPATG